ncbi:MAG TPA: ribonuclease HII [Candidatus Paceibacterota bacterium]|nr:ribonuclease HII [Candidatus Paceibacterota bacterium]
MIIGIDEVGRGPIAGPVCVAAFLVSQPARFARAVEKAKREGKLPIRDSKKLTKAQRETWNSIVQAWKAEGKCDFAIAMISAAAIDRIGIAPSIRRALSTSLNKVYLRNTAQGNVSQGKFLILLDGGLRAPAEFTKQKTIIRGDEKELAISFASIIAKVHRDRHMAKAAKKHAAYGFDSHVGYGTKAHYAAIKKHGLTPLHRRSFIHLT